jgi:hypothetical protein
MNDPSADVCFLLRHKKHKPRTINPGLEFGYYEGKYSLMIPLVNSCFQLYIFLE